MVDDPMFAKFRGNKFFVKDIICLENPDKKITSAYSSVHSPMFFSKFEYKIGEIVNPDKYDKDDDEVCTNGIHFFKSFEAAYHFRDYSDKYTGYEMDYNDNGKSIIRNIYYFNGKYYLFFNEGTNGIIPFWRKGLIAFKQLREYVFAV